MGRLIDVDKLNRKDVNCANVPMNFIDTAPTVEAIPKAEYENRLKADMVAMLTELKKEIEDNEKPISATSYDGDLYNGAFNDGLWVVSDIIQQKIDALKEIEPQKSEDNNAEVK